MSTNPKLGGKANNGRPAGGPRAANGGVAALLMLMAAASGADPVTSVGPAQMPQVPVLMEAAAAVAPGRDWAPEVVRLDPPVGAMSAAAASGRGPLQIGFGRPVAPLEDAERFAARQVWHKTKAGGYAAAFQVTSPEALGLRLGLRVAAIPDEALIRFYDPAGTVVHSIKGMQIKAIIQGNLAAGDTGEDAETYWSPLIEGETQVMDIELPPGADPGNLRIAVPRLSHLFESPRGSGPVRPAAAAWCHNDVTCYPQWAPESNATARMVYVVDGWAFLCTGTLLNDKDPSTFIPYFLSANHCISTQSVASTLQTYWFYRSAACYGGPGPYETRNNGADLLYATTTTDTSFMRLRDNPPGGAVFAGWSASLPGFNESLTGLHHPDGDLQKISFGHVDDYGECVIVGEQVFCVQTEPADATHFEVSWSSGTAQPGSSGSGIFNANHRLVGTLTAVNLDYCAVQRYGDYGRFDLPFYDGLYLWLSSSAGTLLKNISTNTQIDAAGSIGGFIVTENARVAILGESFDSTLDQTLEVRTYPGNLLVGSNNNWADDPSAAELQQIIGRAPLNPTDAGTVLSLPPGGYVASVRDVQGRSGRGIVSITKDSAGGDPLKNLSTNTLVDAAGAIAGFIMEATARVAILGESFDSSLDQTLEVRSYPDNLLVGSNNNWADDPAAGELQQIIGRAPLNPTDAGTVITLQKGSYIATVRDVQGRSGRGIVSVTKQ